MPSKTIRRALILLIWQIGAAVALLFVAELAFRWFDPKPEKIAKSEDILQLDAELGWRLKPGFRGDAFGGSRRITAEGFQSVDRDQIPPGASAQKIVVLGDSRSFGNGVEPEQTYAERLDTLLPNYDVVNLAVPGWSSAQGLLKLDSALAQFSPEIVIFAFGFNDRRSQMNAERTDGALAFAQSYRKSKRLEALQRFRLPSFFAGLSSAPSRTVSVLDLFPRVRPDQFAENLRTAQVKTRAAGGRLLIPLFPDSPIQSRELNRGVILLRQGQLIESEAALRKAIQNDNTFSVAARRALADLRLKQGKNLEDIDALVTPVVSVFGGRPLSSQLDYADAIPELDLESVVDLRPWFQNNPETFYDFCHFREDGHQEVAEALADVIGRLLKLPQDVEQFKRSRRPAD